MTEKFLSDPTGQLTGVKVAMTPNRRRLQPGGAMTPACTTFHPYFAAAEAGLWERSVRLRLPGLADQGVFFSDVVFRNDGSGYIICT